MRNILRRARRHIGIGLALLLTVMPFGPSSLPAKASGVGNFQFNVTGTLPKFPTDYSNATFSGSVTGNATVTGIVSGSVYTANLTMTSAPMSGSIGYSVAYKPYCFVTTNAHPGSAATPFHGSVTMTAVSPTVTGQVYRAGNFLMGVVTKTVTTFTFDYMRVGAVANLVITGGTITVYHTTPGQGTGSFSSGFSGDGQAVVSFNNPQQAVENCLNGTGPGIGYTLTGDVTVAG